MEQCLVTITLKNGKVIKEPYGDYARCNNCGKPCNQVKDIITSGQLVDGEWACCKECYEEMIGKGCCFEELGDLVYRMQKY